MFENVATKSELAKYKRLKERYNNAVERVFAIMNDPSFQRRNPKYKEAQNICRILDRQMTEISCNFLKR